jgi:hypothetical protein
VVLQMRGTTDPGMRDLPGHIAHATAVSESEWLIGCELLEPLTDDELEALL